MKKKKLEKKNKFKRDKYIRLDKNFEKNHVYLINGKSHIKLGYKSVTKFIEQFFESFDSGRIINRYYESWQEKKHLIYFLMSKKEIASLWENKGKKARIEGTKMHDAFEFYANDLEFDSIIKEIRNFMNWYDSEILEPIRTEFTVYGSDEKIIGNIDLIYKNKEGDLCIVDYKRTDVPNDYTFGKECTGLDMPHTKGSKHTIQLNLYKHLLEKYYGLEIKHIYNLYIKEDLCEFVEQDIINVDEVIKWN